MYSIIAADCLKKNKNSVFPYSISNARQFSQLSSYQSYALINFVWYRKKITKLNASECIQNWPRAILITTENKIYLFQFHDNKLAAF